MVIVMRITLGWTRQNSFLAWSFGPLIARFHRCVHPNFSYRAQVMSRKIYSGGGGGSEGQREKCKKQKSHGACPKSLVSQNKSGEN